MTMPDVRMRKATLADTAALARLNKQLIEDEGHDNPMTIRELQARMVSFLTTDYTAYLAEIDDGGEPAGYCLYRHEDEAFYLRHLFTSRHQRRQGIATAMLNWLFAHIFQHAPVRLDVLAHNHGAIRFYERFGFEIACLTYRLTR